ncbi:hypothetical protein SteCoe_1585 [Stentor coeruleus]|uniref:Uncharacterized protein n=1 Tax=Stentor coeruleus TaxID=5963 RepID=A0A1R2D1D2_9CILI|nr:hypothetical protein SteCoe_1585 [Stentor coeruleus]
MLTWTKDVCRNMYKLSKSITQVEKAEFTHKENKLIVLAAPYDIITFENVYQEPLLKLLIDIPKNLVCIQHNPIKTMLRFRHTNSTLNENNPQLSKENHVYEFSCVQDWQECRATLPLHQYHKEKTNDTEVLIRNMHSNIIGKDISKFPFIDNSLVIAMLKDSNPVLVDIPEPLFRQNLGNSISLGDIKMIYDSVVSNLKERNMPESKNYITGNELAHEMFPEIFQKQRDLFTMSFLKLLADNHNITAVVSAPTFVAMQSYWDEILNFSDYNKVLDRKFEESEESVLEKQAILDVVMNSKCWNERFMANRFCYIDKLVNIDEERKKKMVEVFLRYYKEYNAEMEKLMEPIFNE